MIRSVLIFLSLIIASPAMSYWEDSVQGLDWRVLAGRYPGTDVAHECAAWGLRIPEIEELQNAYHNGLADPAVNPGFGQVLRERGVFYSGTFAPSRPHRYIFNMATGTTEIAVDRSNVFRGIACVTVPGSRRYWQDENQNIYFYRGTGRSTIGAARSTCYSHLGDRWVSTIDELTRAFSQGLSDPVLNTVFGAAVGQYDIVVSSTPVGSDPDPTHYWAVDVRNHSKIEVPVTGRYYFVCSNIVD